MTSFFMNKTIKNRPVNCTAQKTANYYEENYLVLENIVFKV